MKLPVIQDYTEDLKDSILITFVGEQDGELREASMRYTKKELEESDSFGTFEELFEYVKKKVKKDIPDVKFGSVWIHDENGFNFERYE